MEAHLAHRFSKKKTIYR